MVVLTPITGIAEKIEKDLDRQREKADKTAKSLVAQATKRKHSADAKDAKKKKKAKKGQAAACADAVARLDEDVEEAERQVTKAEEAEQAEADAKLALEKALAGIKAPTTVPLNNAESRGGGRCQDGRGGPQEAHARSATKEEGCGRCSETGLGLA